MCKEAPVKRFVSFNLYLITKQMAFHSTHHLSSSFAFHLANKPTSIVMINFSFVWMKSPKLVHAQSKIWRRLWISNNASLEIIVNFDWRLAILFRFSCFSSEQNFPWVVRIQILTKYFNSVYLCLSNVFYYKLTCIYHSFMRLSIHFNIALLRAQIESVPKLEIFSCFT